jgi:hypothetical protein
MPTFLILLNCFLAVYKGFHAMVIQGVWLAQVNDVEFVVVISLGVADPEVEPLSYVLDCTVVLLQF